MKSNKNSFNDISQLDYIGIIFTEKMQQNALKYQIGDVFSYTGRNTLNIGKKVKITAIDRYKSYNVYHFTGDYTFSQSDVQFNQSIQLGVWKQLTNT